MTKRVYIGAPGGCFVPGARVELGPVEAFIHVQLGNVAPCDDVTANDTGAPVAMDLGIADVHTPGAITRR